VIGKKCTNLSLQHNYINKPPDAWIVEFLSVIMAAHSAISYQTGMIWFTGTVGVKRLMHYMQQITFRNSLEGYALLHVRQLVFWVSMKTR
tara:strand:+ start:117 stop:386 length:270 start_codon:yes stop_codon:yes gene_type:complete